MKHENLEQVVVFAVFPSKDFNVVLGELKGRRFKARVPSTHFFFDLPLMIPPGEFVNIKPKSMCAMHPSFKTIMFPLCLSLICKM